MKSSEFITESIIDVNVDVDRIYKHFFEEVVTDIANNTWDGLVYPNETDTSKLISPMCIRAHEINPCQIHINHTGSSNFYRPGEHLISLSLNANALAVYRVYKADAVNHVNDAGNLLRFEITPAIVKGSIHHELSHWIRDSLHNSISPLIKSATETSRSTLLPSGKNINAHHIEIDSQVHNFVQLKRELTDVWDHLTFKQAISHSPALNHVFKTLPEDEKYQWIRALRSRLAREDLLGKNMTGTVK